MNSLKTSKLTSIYMKLTVKTPITILTIIIVGLISMYYLTVTTSTNNYKTYIAAVISNDSGDPYIEVSDKELIDMIDSVGPIYWYIDKQDILHKAAAYELLEKNNKKVLRIIPGEGDMDILGHISNRSIRVDIAVDKVSILDRIIGKGRVNNG